MSGEYDGPWPGDLPDDQPWFCSTCDELVDEDDLDADGTCTACATAEARSRVDEAYNGWQHALEHGLPTRNEAHQEWVDARNALEVLTA